MKQMRGRSRKAALAWGVVSTVKIILLVLIIVLLTIFFLQNRGAAVVYVPFGRPYQVGLIYMLLTTFCLGVLFALCVVAIVNSKMKRRKAMRELEEESFDLIERE